MLLDNSLVERVYSVLFTIMQDGYDNMSLVLSRLIALAQIYSIDLFWYVEQKMRYNKMRPYKNGKKY